MATTYADCRAVRRGEFTAAGHGRMALPARATERAWARQCAAWMLRADRPEAIRLWEVRCARKLGMVIRAVAGGPDGVCRLLRIFEIDDPARRRIADGYVEGPVFALTFRDARALWQDRQVVLWPAVDRIEVAAQPLQESLAS